ncbi:AsmA-like C-terminal region-containing protein [Candidatus Trichorickettsia mobilis]|uniref:AsmA-like C-terminal region-containing protein n=1 Tax=Candidatus Trichorickettsia mobilis TaxID=1346319 RepID=UPI00292EF95A|nr:AsmA-like C-terminal region-containing protein [Candidatus Trichorickettsia mobilis]
MKRTIITLVVCITLVGGLFGALFFIDYKSICVNFLAKQKTVEFDSQAIGKVKLVALPWPTLVIDTIANQELELQDIEFRFSFISLLKFQPKINFIKISNAKLNLPNIKFSVSTHDRLITNLVNYVQKDIDININHLTFIDPTNNSIINIDNFIGAADNSFSGNIEEIAFSGFFRSTTDSLDITLNLNTPGYELQLSETYKDNRLSSGTVTAKIKSLPELINYHLPDASPLLAKITQNEPIAINFDIVADENLLQFKAINIKANSVIGSGEITLAKNDNATNVIALKFAKIDLKSLLSPSTNDQNTSYKSQERFIFANNSLNAVIEIDQIILSNDDIINQFKLITDLQQGQLLISDFSGIIASGGRFQLNGIVTQNSVRSIFNGKFTLQHSNFNTILSLLGCTNATVERVIPFALSAEVKCTPIDLSLQNLLLKTNDLEITGSISSKFIGVIPRIKSFLRFSQLDLDQTLYPVITPMLNFAKSLTENMKAADYLSKFVPIRALSYLGNFDVTIDNLKLAQKDLGLANIVLSITPAKIIVNNLYTNKGQDYIRATGKLLTDGLSPQLVIQITDAVIPVSFLSPGFLLELRNNLLNNFSLDKILLQLDCFFSKIYQNDLVLEKVTFSTKNDNTLFKIPTLKAQLLNGTIEVEGSVLLDPYTWNLVYALNTIDVAALSKILPVGWLNSDGSASVNGMITTNGDSIEKLLYNLYTKSSFVAKNVKINNFSIDTLIANISQPNYDITQFKTDLNNALSTGQTQINSLSSDLELIQGVATLKNTTLQTKYANAAVVAAINIYDLQLNLSSLFSFYAFSPAPNGSKYNSSVPTSLGIKSAGTIIAPQLTADSTSLTEFLQKQQINNKNTNNNSPTQQ